jgi:hypothetical protein
MQYVSYLFHYFFDLLYINQRLSFASQIDLIIYTYTTKCVTDLLHMPLSRIGIRLSAVQPAIRYAVVYLLDQT